MTIAERIVRIRTQIQELEQRYQRPPDSVALMAVSKTFPASAIREAASTGQCHFGENYVQELAEKVEQLADLPIEWHFIGPLQSNKTKIIAEHVNWVHSVDREKIARRLNDQRPSSLSPLNVCIQVNISEEPQKAGVLPDQLATLATFISSQPQLRLRGLMAIPAASQNFAEQLANFKSMRQLFDKTRAHYPELDTLSMGMSGDMEAAIAAGSTMVRIGSAIFGQRDYATRNPQ